MVRCYAQPAMCPLKGQLAVYADKKTFAHIVAMSSVEVFQSFTDGPFWTRINRNRRKNSE